MTMFFVGHDDGGERFSWASREPGRVVRPNRYVAIADGPDGMSPA
jgi:hypothetical protein